MKPLIMHYLPSFNDGDLLINNESTAERYLDGVIEPAGNHDFESFNKDNQLIINWFSQLAELFACWQEEYGRVWDKDNLCITGARSFGASYLESDLDCAIVSEDFEEYLAFCSFLKERYEASHDIYATNTEAGLPLFIVKKKGAHFDCPLLNTSYPDNKFPKLEITFRSSAVHEAIQNAGQLFFDNLPQEALWNYIINKRRLTLMLRSDISDQITRDVLITLKQALMQPLNILQNEQINAFPLTLSRVKEFRNRYQRIDHPPAQISSTLSREAALLLKNSGELTPEQNKPLRLLAKGDKLAPNDWALAQENFEKGSQLLNFFQKHRDQISSQLKLNGKYYTSVPIFTFSHQGELHVLLMENKGLQQSSDVNETQWTAHGTRVDSREKELLNNPEIWALFDTITRRNPTLNYLLAAAYRCLGEMGLEVTEAQLTKTHLINREKAGFPEENGSYHTAFFHIDLGEQSPQDIMRRCHSPTSSRYGHWTECFKVSELLEQVVEAPHPTKKRETYQLLKGDKRLTVRMTTMRFIMALSMLKEVPSDSKVNSPWQLYNLSTLEMALTWINNRADESVQASLFSNQVIAFSSAETHAFAFKAEMNEENLAYKFIKPERLVWHHLIAALTVRTKIQNKEELASNLSILTKIYNERYFPKKGRFNSLLFKYLRELKELLQSYPLPAADKGLLESNKAYARMNTLFNIISKRELSHSHKAIYHLSQTDAEIALYITAYEFFHAEVTTIIKEEVAGIIQEAIDNRIVEALDVITPDEQLFFGVTGPVASGKSVSEGLARQELKGQSAAFISSDEWNDILIEALQLGSYKKQQGKLTLAEAWPIKVLIWQLLAEMKEQNLAIHLIQEAMSPLGLSIPQNGKTAIFLNTASPAKAVPRVQLRGERTGRFVAGAETFASYRWPWLNLVAVINSGIATKANLCLNVLDTDLSYKEQGCSASSTIATLKNSTLNIHNLQRVVYFVNRGYMINPAPKSQADCWLMPQMDMVLLNAELDKLYTAKHPLTVQLNGIEISKDELFAKVKDILVANQHVETESPEEKFTIPTLKEQLETLSSENKEFLDYYGIWNNSAQQNAALSITSIDEFAPIRNSLYQLFVFLNYTSAEEIKAVLLKPHQEEGYSFAGLDADSSALTKNIEALCELRDKARQQFSSKEIADEHLVKCFLIHNLGKMKAFLQQDGVDKGSASSSSHDLYLTNWLSDKPDLDSAYREFAPWIDAFIGLGYNPNIMAKPDYVGALAGVKEHIQKLGALISEGIEESKISKGVEESDSFKTLFTTLPLVSYYGDWGQSPSDRASLSITGTDEYSAIRTSLYLIFAFIKNESIDDIKNILIKPHEVEGFSFTGIADTADLITNIKALLEIRNSARQQWGINADEYLIKSFVIHDLGKMEKFLLDQKLVIPGEMSASSHDLYINSWLEGDQALKLVYKALSNWVDVFDGAGHNPQQLARKDYVGKLTGVNQHIEMIRKSNQQTMNSFLYQKAKALKLPLADFSFLIHQNTFQQSWLDLTFEQQEKIVMIIWTSPFVFVKSPLTPEKVSQDFIEIWQSNKHEKIVSEITHFMIKNMMSDSDNFIFLYNITGLIHHRSEQNGSHFANGGTVEDLFTTFFPFVLKVVSGKTSILIEEAKPRGLNGFQALQGVEMNIQFFSHLLNNSAPRWRDVDFASPQCKEMYLETLDKTIKARKARVNNPHRFMPTSATATNIETSKLKFEMS